MDSKAGKPGGPLLEALNPELIRRAQEGETLVVSEIYDRYQRSIFRYLFYRVGDQQTAEDLTSEVFLRMIEKISSYRDQRASFQAWLFQIARNLSIDHYRKMKALNEFSLEDDYPEPGEQPAEIIDRDLTSEKLYQALAELPDNQHDVIVMRFVVGMPVGEVADTLHKSEDSIKGLQRRALLTLREILTEWEVVYV
jgi:RNA polymerase sigma-70 factor (ECF subfamily)